MQESVTKLINLLYKLFEESGSYFGERGELAGSKLAYERAARENLIVIVPQENQLFVDIDNDFQYAIYQRNLPLLRNFYTVTGTSENLSKSEQEDRKHVTVNLADKVTSTERLILQAFLGSDLKREFLGLQRIRGNDPVPTLFFEKAPTALGEIGICYNENDYQF